MKKLLSIFGILLFFGSLAITSCSSSSRMCPAYPPSVYHGDAQNINSFETVEFQNSENL